MIDKKAIHFVALWKNNFYGILVSLVKWRYFKGANCHSDVDLLCSLCKNWVLLMLLYKIHDFPLAISSWQVFQTLPKTISDITWASRAMEISGNIDKNRGEKDLSSSLWVQKSWELIIFSTSTAFFFFWEGEILKAI